MPDVYVKCDVCKSLRFNQATLEVKYKGKSIADCLKMTVEEAIGLFANIPKIKFIGYDHKIKTPYSPNPSAPLSFHALGISN